ncbi:stage II sporulation protein M [Candidatus Woesearchaeota archaeon]|nr:stage II sporulation protein M [Candidatus Woesearchaeota archaeon]
MVLESLISPEKAEKRPWELFFLGFIYVTLSILLSILIFEDENISVLIVTFVVMSSSILIYNTLKYEKDKDILNINELNLLKRHAPLLLFFVFLFSGFVFGYFVWYILIDTFPDIFGTTVSNVFNLQIKTISSINPSLVSESFRSSISGNAFLSSTFWNIFINNFGVLFLSFIFSFIYGLGAIFILTWNASVLGVAVRLFFKNYIFNMLINSTSISFFNYLSAFSLAFFRFLVHGLPEMLSYFIAGVSGGIISIAIINKNVDSFDIILKDSFILLLISLALLFASALLEVYFTLSIF